MTSPLLTGSVNRSRHFYSRRTPSQNGRPKQIMSCSCFSIIVRDDPLGKSGRMRRGWSSAHRDNRGALQLEPLGGFRRYRTISAQTCVSPHWRRFRLTTDVNLCGTDKLQQESLTPEIRPERQRPEGLMESILHPPTCVTVVMMTARRRRNCLIYVNPPDLSSQVDGNVGFTTVFLN